MGWHSTLDAEQKAFDNSYLYAIIKDLLFKELPMHLTKHDKQCVLLDIVGNMQAAVRAYAARLNIENPECEKKAMEFFRLVQCNMQPSSLKVLHLHSSNLALVCLNLACDVFLERFDKQGAAILFGKSLKFYQKCYDQLHKLLNLGPADKNHIKNIITLLAKGNQRMMCNRYLKLCKASPKFKKVEPDALACAILYNLARKEETGVKLKTFQSRCKLRLKMFKNLTVELEKFLNLDASQASPLKDSLQKYSAKLSQQRNYLNSSDEEPEPLEEYDSWKQRILSSLEHTKPERTPEHS